MLKEKELAERWGIHPGSLKNQRHRRQGCPFVKIPGVGIRYRLTDVERVEEESLVATR